jgi:hypothetical protein
MSYRLVQGTFALRYATASRRVGSKPDGDSVWFKPKKKKNLDGLGRRVDFNKGGFAQLRAEAMDAIELQFEPNHHQDETLAKAARDFLLAGVGFTSVQYAESGMTVTGSTPEAVPGYILTRSVDPYGRPVSFVYAGVPDEADGSEVFLKVARLNDSLNAELVAAGHAYPMYYAGLPTDLRNRITTLATSARQAGHGFWPKDVSLKPTAVANIANLETLVLWPKVFRRLVSFFNDGGTSLKDFDAWLRVDEKRDDELWIAPLGQLANMHDVVEVSNGKLRMKYPSEDLIVVAK